MYCLTIKASVMSWRMASDSVAISMYQAEIFSAQTLSASLGKLMFCNHIFRPFIACVITQIVETTSITLLKIAKNISDFVRSPWWCSKLCMVLKYRTSSTPASR